jgi:pyridoxal biosynthesis lyase PdxS
LLPWPFKLFPQISGGRWSCPDGKPEIIQQIIETVTIPVKAKARIGHFVEAEILEALGVGLVCIASCK